MYSHRHTDTDTNGHWLWTVGFQHPNGEWEPESDHSSEESARQRVHYLNGGTDHDQRNDEPTALANHQGDIEVAEQVEPVNPYPKTKHPGHELPCSICDGQVKAYEEGDASGYARGKAERDAEVERLKGIVVSQRAEMVNNHTLQAERDEVVADLLEACEFLIRHEENGDLESVDFEAIRQAIAKAVA